MNILEMTILLHTGLDLPHGQQTPVVHRGKEENDARQMFSRPLAADQRHVEIVIMITTGLGPFHQTRNVPALQQIEIVLIVHAQSPIEMPDNRKPSGIRKDQENPAPRRSEAQTGGLQHSTLYDSA
jgi:hypothetical protein